MGAQARIADEAESSLKIGRILARAAILNARMMDDPRNLPARLKADLPHVRHLTLLVLPPDEAASDADLPAPPISSDEAPSWFIGLFDQPHDDELFSVTVNGRDFGRILLRSNPIDEIEEIWVELKFLCELLTVLSLVIMGLIFWSVTHALRPIRSLALGFDRLERGQFNELLEPIPVAELRRIGDQFNSLARSLQRITADNHLLIDKLISIQEAERKEIAQELHDEIGPSLFGIRTDVSWIIKTSQADEPNLHEIEERAHSIVELADGIQHSNYRMLERLRPLVLDQMGLAEALRQLIVIWRARYPEISWSLDMPVDINAADEAVNLTLYRVVQECLTNVVRHADAKDVRVVVALRLDEDTGKPGTIIQVEVRDDGTGFSPDFRFGFGLLGMSERVRALQGQMKASNLTPSGSMIAVTIPADMKGSP